MILNQEGTSETPGKFFTHTNLYLKILSQEV